VKEQLRGRGGISPLHILHSGKYGVQVDEKLGHIGVLAFFRLFPGLQRQMEGCVAFIVLHRSRTVPNQQSGQV